MYLLLYGSSKGHRQHPDARNRSTIVESVETLLDPLREAWETHCKQNGLGKVGINISSGYRCPALNKAVGGSTTSAHRYGYAFDLVPTTGRCGRSSVSAATSSLDAPSTN